MRLIFYFIGCFLFFDSNIIGQSFDNANRRLAEGDYRGAIQEYDRIIKMNPTNAIAYNLKGQADKHSGDRSAALWDFTEAINLDSNYCAAYINRGFIRLSFHVIDAAIADFSKAVSLRPGDAEGYLGRGKGEEEIGQFAQAQKDYEKALQIRTNDASALCGLGKICFRAGKFDEAKTNYIRALMAPNHFRAAAYAGLADVYLTQTNTTQALQFYIQAQNCEPDSIEIQIKLGNTLLKMGRNEDALSHFKKVLSLNPDSAAAQNGLKAAQAKIKSGRP